MMSKPQHRRLSNETIVVASHNQGKVREILDLLVPFGVNVKSAAELGLPEPEETGATFAENAIIKAQAAALQSDLPALADDSGLCVTALDDAPGIYSARWAGPSRDFMMAMSRVNQELDERSATSRRAHFFCCLCLAWPGGDVETFEGQVDGDLIWPPRGDKGFGYDPMFVPDGETLTFGEIEPDTKHAMSHRARAFRQLVNACFTSK